MARQQLLNQQQHKHLARRIHDEISQKMTLLALQLSLASSDETAPEDWATKCKDWAALVMELGQSIRDITNELQPKIVDEFGLASALRWFAQTPAANSRCAFVAPAKDIALSPFAANELFALCRDIVTEILAPAGAAMIEIELQQKDGAVRLQVRARDNGDGKELITKEGLDAISMPDRLLCLEGTSELNHSPGACAVLTLSVPDGRPA
jgi:signal transduction histidine kinase